VTMIFGTIYVATQQTIRLSANDVPGQVNLQYRGQRLADINLPKSSTITPVNGVFTLFYDQSGKQVAGGNTLYGQRLAAIPVGVLKHATATKDNRVTWQPEADLRFATVTTKLADGYVMSAQSLEPYEARINTVTAVVLLGYLATELAIVISYILLQRQLERTT